jgi:hypothetical protein
LACTQDLALLKGKGFAPLDFTPGHACDQSKEVMDSLNKERLRQILRKAKAVSVNGLGKGRSLKAQTVF